MAAAAIDGYLRRRRDSSPFVCLASGQKFLTINALRKRSVADCRPLRRFSDGTRVEPRASKGGAEHYDYRG